MKALVKMMKDYEQNGVYDKLEAVHAERLSDTINKHEISTVKSIDNEGFETAICKNFKFVVVECYDNTEDAKRGHEWWVNHYESNKNMAHNALINVLEMIDTLHTRRIKNYEDIVQFNKISMK